ncbi:hypothetical protein HU200_010900 [Digitaria exilis]|uniref:SPX domain-containing protein n=1 Tax=Digitaria exilis TaxID=1010633 RepID=A0A835FHG1_9POAL|nr:hypothetical protein HU200_010900 [Digitaria exilis]
MKFGKDFRNHLEETLPAWRDKYLAYKALKKLIKNLRPPDPAAAAALPLPPPPAAEVAGSGAAAQGNVAALGNWFASILDMELHKLNDFYMEREEWYVIRLQVRALSPCPRPHHLSQRSSSMRVFCAPDLGPLSDFGVVPESQAFTVVRCAVVVYQRIKSDINIAPQLALTLVLKERIERVKAKKNDAFTSKSEFTEEMLEIRLVKILKKYDKRTGGLLSLPFTQRARHQPFFTTEPLTRLVRECEANLELLFPVEAEILEPSSSSNLEQHDASRRDPTSCDVETSDVYRSTLAAMKAIQGLRRASSTYNPLSLSRFFNGEDGEPCSGAITSESSLSDSSTDSQIQDADKDGKEVQSNSREQNAAQRGHNAEGEPRDE